jgi:transketolase
LPRRPRHALPLRGRAIWKATIRAGEICISGYASTLWARSFSDYMKPPIRLSALMEIPVIYIFTHDSIGVGYDGPTHQPIEQLIALRSIPGLLTLRPADANEVTEAWRVIIELKHQPACLILTRQPLPTFDRKRYAPASGVSRGAYILADDATLKPKVILIGTGSELALCIDAYENLQLEGIPARVVSMPSWELFEQQDQSYREHVLPPEIRARLSVEMGSVIGWDRYVGRWAQRLACTRSAARRRSKIYW